MDDPPRPIHVVERLPPWRGRPTSAWQRCNGRFDGVGRRPAFSGVSSLPRSLGQPQEGTRSRPPPERRGKIYLPWVDDGREGNATVPVGDPVQEMARPRWQQGIAQDIHVCVYDLATEGARPVRLPPPSDLEGARRLAGGACRSGPSPMNLLWPGHAALLKTPQEGAQGRLAF